MKLCSSSSISNRLVLNPSSTIRRYSGGKLRAKDWSYDTEMPRGSMQYILYYPKTMPIGKRYVRACDVIKIQTRSISPESGILHFWITIHMRGGQRRTKSGDHGRQGRRDGAPLFARGGGLAVHPVLLALLVIAVAVLHIHSDARVAVVRLYKDF